MTTIAEDVADEELMELVRSGDVTQLGHLFERHHVGLFDFLYRTTGDRECAEDLVQDVFVRMLKYRHTYRSGSSVVTWMFRIARNARSDHFRRRHGREGIAPGDVSDVTELDPPSHSPDPREQYEWRLEATRLREALRRLPEDKRELIVLARYQRMPYEQLAEILDIDVGALKVRVHRALKQLRMLLDHPSTRRDPCGAKTPFSTSDRS